MLKNQNHSANAGLTTFISLLFGMASIVIGGLLLYRFAITHSGNQQSKIKQLTQAELFQLRNEEIQLSLERKREKTELLVTRMHRRYLIDNDSTMNFLVISKGGEHGAFGTGFLLGWSDVKEESMKMPEFDGVTGVSAGSLIAPYAYIGTKDALKTIDNFFRNTTNDFIKLRKPIYFLPSNISLATVPGLENAVDQAFTIEFAKEIIKKTTPGRLLLIKSTNLDLAFPKIFDFIKAAKESIALNNPNQMVDIVLSSSAIPGVFPPREINNFRYVDGSVEGNFYYGGHPSEPQNTFGGIWKKRFPNLPIPKTRYWVIINGNLREPPKNSKDGWAGIAARGLSISVGSSQIVALRELFALADITRLRGLGDVEVRWVAINEPLQPDRLHDLFDRKEMQKLSDLGRKIGSNPKSWNSASP